MAASTVVNQLKIGIEKRDCSGSLAGIIFEIYKYTKTF